MNHKLKIAIGCFVQWYEHEIFDEYIHSLAEAIKSTDNDIHVDILINATEYLEQCNTDVTKLVQKIKKSANQSLRSVKCTKNIQIYQDKEIYTIANYRYDFNANHTEYDLLVWGETDMLCPVQMFQFMNSLPNPKHNYYVATFGGPVMWGKEWDHLTFEGFADKPFIKNDLINPWSFRYSHSYESMLEINRQASNKIIQSPLFFHGCGLIITPNIIKSGINVPKTHTFFVAEDTGFNRMLPMHLPFFVFKDVFMPHNRKHPKKRMNIVGEESIDDRTNLELLRQQQRWYKYARDFSIENLFLIKSPGSKLKGWDDVFIKDLLDEMTESEKNLESQ